MAEFQSKFTGQEVDNAIDKLRAWIVVDGTYPTVTISGVTYAVIWKSIPVSGTSCYGIGLHPTTGRIYEIYYNGSSYTATALDTDTKNTAGSTNSTSKLFLVGAGSQAVNPQTFSNSQVYTTDGTLYLTKATDLSGTANNHPALIVGGADTAAHLELDANEIHAKASGNTTAPLYLNHEGGNTYLSGENTYSDGTYLYSDSKKVSVDGHTHNKSEVGLGNVDNTSDADKPVSNATQQALNLKANASDVYTKTETDNGINKSLYNLGYYDTITANSDGTYTITRQTGYLVLDGVNAKVNAVDSSYFVWFNFFSPNKEAFTLVVSAFGVSTTTNWDTNDGFYFNPASDYRLILKATKQPIRTIDEWNTYLIQNPISIQYKLATATTEKVEANHYARYNQTFILEHNKSEAERSANVWNEEWELGDFNWNTGEPTNNNSRYRSKSFSRIKPSTSYFISAPNGIDILFYDSSKNYIINIYRNNASFVTPNNAYYLKICNTATNVYNNDVMLNEGTTPLPYQPYEGKVVHEKELGDYLTLSGGSLTGGLALYAASGDSPRLTFQRGNLDDAFNDWSLYEGSNGYLYIQQRGQGSTEWETRATFRQSDVNFAGKISEDGTYLVDKYLGKTAKAADADKLDGNDSTYYLNYNNLTNKPTLGTAAGNIPVLDNSGKLAESVIPAVAITDTYVVATETAMLALSAQKGDIAIRSDLNKSFVLQATPASTLANWKELLTPTDAVLSVNGKTGTVTLNLDDIGDGSTRKLANYVPKSLTSAKGDMIYASAANTPARLGIGSNGQFLSIANGIPTWVNNPNTDTHYTNYLQIKGNGTEAVKFEQNANKTLNLKPSGSVSISAAAGEITISATDTNTAAAADNILDGSNSGTTITYAPYTSQQSKLSFDTSTTAPTRTDRLNLNGYLYATKFNVAGKAAVQYNSTEDCIEFIFA